MTPIVQSLNEEWASIVSSPTARRALMRWATANPVLEPARSVDDLIDTRSHPAWGRDAHRVLAHEAPVDHLAARTLLQALLGGLVHLSHKVGDGDPDAIDELISLAWAWIRTYPWQRHGAVAPNVLLDVRKQFLHLRHPDAPETEPRPVFDRPIDPATPEQILCGEAIFDHLASAKDLGLVSNVGLATVLRTRVGGETLIDVAADLGLSPDATWRRRTQAEERLLGLCPSRAEYAGDNSEVTRHETANNAISIRYRRCQSRCRGARSRLPDRYEADLPTQCIWRRTRSDAR